MCQICISRKFPALVISMHSLDVSSVGVGLNYVSII